MTRPDIGTRAAAQRLGVSQRTIQRLARRHRIGYVLCGIRVFRPVDVERLKDRIASNRQCTGRQGVENSRNISN